MCIRDSSISGPKFSRGSRTLEVLGQKSRNSHPPPVCLPGNTGTESVLRLNSSTLSVFGVGRSTGGEFAGRVCRHLALPADTFRPNCVLHHFGPLSSLLHQGPLSTVHLVGVDGDPITICLLKTASGTLVHLVQLTGMELSATIVRKIGQKWRKMPSQGHFRPNRK